MRTSAASLLVLSLAVLARGVPARGDATAPAAPAPADVPGAVTWLPSVSAAVASAKATHRPLFVAVHATRGEGAKADAGGRELRERTYKDPVVVTRSRSFACAIVYVDAGGADVDELRTRFDAGAAIVTPQHVFGFSDGTKLDRREYWTYAAGAESVDALVAMMDRAATSEAARAGPAPGTPPAATAPPTSTTPAPPPAPVPGDAPPVPAPVPGAPIDPAAADPARVAYIAAAIAKIRDGTDPAERGAAVRDLLAKDQKGDCLAALCALALEAKKDPALRITIVRAVGRPGLEGAVPMLLELIDERVDDVRSNAIVSLEYVGSGIAAEALSKHVGKEKEDKIRSNTCRALGRCAAKQEWARKALVRELQTAKNDTQFAGATIGLAYFEKDADAARALEKEAKKAGIGPRRGFSLWALTEILDPKSAEFVKKEVLSTEKNQWVLPWVNAVYSVLSGEGSGESKQTVEGGMSFVVGQIPLGIADGARRDRSDAGFKPKGEFEAGGRGGGRGGPGGGGPGGGGGMGG